MSAPDDQNPSHQPPGGGRQDSAEAPGGPAGDAGSRSRGPGVLGENTLWAGALGAPRREDIRLTPERIQVILRGDPGNDTIGGHLHGTGRPGTSEFPASWSPAEIIGAVLLVALDPEEIAEAPQGPPGIRWFEGWQDGVNISGVVRDDGEIEDAYPATYPHEGQHPCVVYNPDPGNPHRRDGITRCGPR